MNKITKWLVCIALAFAPLVHAYEAIPGAGLIGTVHDFASGTGDGAGYMNNQLDGNGNDMWGENLVGLCAYCHTPHSAISTSLLWNHKMSKRTFTWVEATTAGGTAYPSITPTYKGASVRCLSCHDGSVAIGDVSIYKGIKGVFNIGTANGQYVIPSVISGGLRMDKNHPVAMPYPFGQVKNTYNGITTGSKVKLADFVAAPENKNGTHVRLYNQTGSGAPVAGGAGATSGIECTSCHDVHNKQTTSPFALLRGNFGGSTAASGYLCLQCHIK